MKEIILLILVAMLCVVFYRIGRIDGAAGAYERGVRDTWEQVGR